MQRAAVIRAAISFAIVASVFALGHLIPLPGAVAQAEWFSRTAPPCIGFHCLHAVPTTHLDGIALAHEPSALLAVCAIAAIAMAVWRRRPRVPAED